VSVTVACQKKSISNSQCNTSWHILPTLVFPFSTFLKLHTLRRNVLTFQDVTAIYLEYPLFWFVEWRSLACYRTFWVAYRPHFKIQHIKYSTFPSIYPELRSIISFCKNPSFVCFPSDGSNITTKLGMAHWWNDTDRGKTDVLGEKPVTVPLCPPQISYVLSWDRNRTSTVRVQRLTTSLNNNIK
jgi:hypothetical protein